MIKKIWQKLWGMDWTTGILFILFVFCLVAAMVSLERITDKNVSATIVYVVAMMFILFNLKGGSK